MEIRVVDFDILTKKSKTYQDGLKNIAEIRKGFIRRMDPLKEEMESIIKAANSGLILDSKSQQEKSQKFQELQDEAMSIDNEFKNAMRSENDDLNKRTYEELSGLIEEWSEGKGVDMIMGKMEVVWCSQSSEITDSILDILKEKGLYVETSGISDEESIEDGQEVIVEDLK
jgi:Skp family chaperone for outer membrane proteins